MGSNQPFLYEADRSSRSSFPEKPFDPKSITRASWEPKPLKPKRDGPLVQINRHPDAHEIITGRAPVKTMSSTMKAWIKAMRVVQLLLRLLQLVAAAGILVLAILITKIPDMTSWVLRITAGFVIVHCIYAVYHLARPAGYRTPASSSAYQVFAAFSDFCILPLYAYGAVAARKNSDKWSTLLANTDILPYLTTSFYYTLIGGTAVHVLTLSVAFWLAIKFRDIASMPPDLNPLEDHYTSRSKKRQQKDLKRQKHLRNKSSVATASTFESVDSLDKAKGFDSRPPSVPFMHTRMGSEASAHYSDPRLSLPSQNSPVASQKGSLANMKRASVASFPNNGRGEYAELPLNDGGYSNAPASRHSYHPNSRPASRPGSRPASRPGSRPNTSIPNNGISSGAAAQPGMGPNGGPNAGRQAKFTETWYTSDSIVNRTQQRNQAVNTMVMNASGKRRNYEVVSQAYDFHDSDDQDSDTETVRHHQTGSGENDENMRYDSYNYAGEDENSHPNPLASNPSPKPNKGQFRASAPAQDIQRQLSDAPSMSSSVHTSTTVLGDVPLNDRRVSGGYTVDIADAMHNGRGLNNGNPAPLQHQQNTNNVSRQASNKRWTWAPRNRDSSIQADEGFSSKRYGDLRSGTPPTMVEDLPRVSKAARQVSSGNDYDLGSDRYLYHGDNNGAANTFSRRNVSGKIAEEGRAYSRYSTPNN
ncbi:hypothetical protein F503_01121 [Ophiostoma piceae UAMH 11346]|uniref:Uncharacterized protein n=1 Tax=Ophiostoma piceae (strain UAMH 11346) TaxID=1262450 RepID=S3CP69_OPHP1|nr:hypothetical protein F503_01121 [Ophiostoma piceae UAMH 11346]